MTTSTELETFIQKFHQLWNDGYSAHLDLDCHAGVACVGLRLQLGQPPGPLHHHRPSPHHSRYFSHSYQRRRERRAAARDENKQHAEEASNLGESAVIKENDEYTEKVPTKENMGTISSNENEENDDEVEECEQVIVEAEKVIQEKETPELLAEKADEKENATGEFVTENKVDENVTKTGDEESIEAANSAPIPEIIPVYCSATLENCPDSHLNEEYGESIKRFLVSEQHLEQNISSAELQYVSSKSCRNNLYSHTVSIVVYVRTARLWESPASYLRKHLGLTNYWTRSNGTVVRLSRIHQK